MSRAMSRRMRRYGILTVIAVLPIAILCAYVSNLLAPTSPLPRPVSAATYNIVETAAINDDSTTIGIADSDMYNASPSEIEARFDEMEALGVNTVRVVIPWAAIKPAQPGSPLETLFPPDWDKMDFIVQEAQDRGFAVLGVLNATPYYGGQDGKGCLGCVGVAPDPTAFADFAAEVADRYKGAISAYEVWNEPNSYKSWSPAVDPEAYTEVLKAAYTAIKSADPNATVVAGVLGAVISFGGFTMDPVSFVKAMYADGAKGFFDALSYHPYNYDKTFAEQNPGFLSPLQMLLGMRQTMLDNGDDLIKIWASEYGLPTSLDPDQDQAYQDQLDFIRDFLNVWGDGLTDAQLRQLPTKYRELAATWKDWIGPAFIYTLRDRLGKEATEQGSLGLFYFDDATGEWKMKPAAEFIKDLIGNPPTGADPVGGDPAGGDIAAALAASLQKLIQSVASSVQNAVSAMHNAVQAVQQMGAQIGNALAKAVAAWAASVRHTPTTTPTVAAVEAVDTAALAHSAVEESVDTSVAKTSAATAASGLSGSATEEVRAADKPAAVEATFADTTEAAADESSESASPEAPKATTPTGDATESKTSDEPVAANDQKTADDPKTTTPANRKDEDEVKGDAKKDDNKKSDGDNDADGATAPGKHAKGTVKNGASVDHLKTKHGDRTAKKSGTPKHAAATAAG
jgi:polysaccharide biosynthesis protein PslG